MVYYIERYRMDKPTRTNRRLYKVFFDDTGRPPMGISEYNKLLEEEEKKETKNTTKKVDKDVSSAK